MTVLAFVIGLSIGVGAIYHYCFYIKLCELQENFEKLDKEVDIIAEVGNKNLQTFMKMMSDLNDSVSQKLEDYQNQKMIH